MRIIIDREQLFTILRAVERFTPRRATRPILEHIRLHISPEASWIYATDIDHAIQVQLDPHQVDGEGDLLLPARLFTDIVRDAGTDHVEIEASGDSALIRTAAETHLCTPDVAEYPMVLSGDLSRSITVPSTVLLDAITSVIYAADEDAPYYVLGGVLIDLSDGQMSLVATDGRRMAVYSVPVEGAAPEGWRSVIPSASGLRAIVPVLRSHESTLRLGVESGFLLIQCPAYTAWIRMIDGRFPDWRRIMPTDQTTHLRVSEDALQTAIRRVSRILTDTAQPIRLILQGGELLLTAESPIGAAQATVPVAVIDDGDVDVRIRPRYLLEALQPARESVAVTYLGPRRPVRIVSGRYTAVIMPVVVAEAETKGEN